MRPWWTKRAFAEKLLEEERVGVVPGSAFGPSGAGHVRVCYATAYEEIVEAMNPDRPVRPSPPRVTQPEVRQRHGVLGDGGRLLRRHDGPGPGTVAAEVVRRAALPPDGDRPRRCHRHRYGCRPPPGRGTTHHRPRRRPGHARDRPPRHPASSSSTPTSRRIPLARCVATS